MAGRRNIAAPFQHAPRSDDSNSNSGGGNSHSASGINFRNFQFQALERLEELQFDKYCGPTPESNWVIPGMLLVGAYPATEDDDETFDLISSILRLGIKKFVCLQSEVST
ncbi:hypothetical protein B484DRAFT_396026 [Ochromonadaceae sp. CCMP2298]|nr:hypothetical protein B484DRAFT_396026 [Ochromonadaceae sp. CCMP2298]